MYLAQAECVICSWRHLCNRQVGTLRLHLHFPLEPRFDAIIHFFPKAFCTHGLTRVGSEPLEKPGKLSANSKLLKTQALHALHPWTAICLAEEVTEKSGLASQRWERKTSRHALSTPDRQAAPSAPLAPWRTTQSPLTCPAALRQLCKAREFQVLQWNKYIGQPYGSLCLLCYTAHAGKKALQTNSSSNSNKLQIGPLIYKSLDSTYLYI